MRVPASVGIALGRTTADGPGLLGRTTAAGPGLLGRARAAMVEQRGRGPQGIRLA